jgi:hypothetical protein
MHQPTEKHTFWLSTRKSYKPSHFVGWIMTLMIFGRVECILRVRMASVRFMRFRRAFVFCLSALLLCVPVSASVCELSCSLSRVDLASEPTEGASATQAHELGISEKNAPHSYCGHVHTARLGSAANHSFENTSKCTDASCVQAATLSRVNSVDDTDSGSVHFVVLASVPKVAFDVQFGTAQHEYALTKFLLLDPLTVSLRI